MGPQDKRTVAEGSGQQADDARRPRAARTMRAPLWALACWAPVIQARRLYGIFPGAGAASETF